jgi:hypothetical protein
MATNANTRSLESKAKFAWKCYFIEREKNYTLQSTRNNMTDMVSQIRNGDTPDITHLTQLFLDMYDKIGQLCDCPICLVQMKKDVTHLPLCGHLICKVCKEKVSSCPICRKKY